MRRKKLAERFRCAFGAVPDVRYEAADPARIRAYYEFRRENEEETFFLDDITWNDLDMEDIFLRINPGLSFSGEQFLYYLLRAPAQTRQEYERRRRVIGLMEKDAALRLEVQLLLSRLGCRRKVELCQAFSPKSHSLLWLAIYVLLFLMLLASAISVTFSTQTGLMLLVLACTMNSIVHEVRVRQVQSDFDTVNYIVNMAFVLRRLRRLHHAGLDRELEQAYEALDDLKAILRTGGVSRAPDDGISAMVTMVTLVDLIAYEFLKRRLAKGHRQLFAIHEGLGKLDAAIAAASWRCGMVCRCDPELDFEQEHIRIEAEGLVHPLLDEPVANDLKAERPVLITGSNASGKSTFLKSAALCAVLSQGLCTAPAQRYTAGAFRVYSSMALSDDLLAGESYYIVETRSLKRILDEAQQTGQPVRGVVDEVLRGTNTVERIAASSQVLAELAGKQVMCLTATHDLELCELLAAQYDLYHFREYIDGERMWFDYLLRPGKAVSRNAINLLRLLGFDEQLVKRAHERANGYWETGIWR